LQLLSKHIESLIFCASDPITSEELQTTLAEMFDTTIALEDITKAIVDLQNKYNEDQYSFGIQFLAGGYQFLTKPAYQTSISILLKQKSRKKLSTSALESLAIIAYKQPISKSETEKIRGVNCDYAIQKLLEKELIEIKGKSDGIGKPLLYGTSTKFMEYFGINNISELPMPKDFEIKNDNTIGQNQEEN
jgi:segregation and condensation protein B